MRDPNNIAVLVIGIAALVAIYFICRTPNRTHKKMKEADTRKKKKNNPATHEHEKQPDPPRPVDPYVLSILEHSVRSVRMDADMFITASKMDFIRKREQFKSKFEKDDWFS